MLQVRWTRCVDLVWTTEDSLAIFAIASAAHVLGCRRSNGSTDRSLRTAQRANTSTAAAITVGGSACAHHLLGEASQRTLAATATPQGDLDDL